MAIVGAVASAYQADGDDYTNRFHIGNGARVQASDDYTVGDVIGQQVAGRQDGTDTTSHAGMHTSISTVSTVLTYVATTTTTLADFYAEIQDVGIEWVKINWS